MMAWPAEAGIASDAAARLVAHMAHDKKKTADGLPFILARGIGDTYVAKGVPLDAVTEFLAADLARREQRSAA
jgi:3-dehydroquinate synthase